MPLLQSVPITPTIVGSIEIELKVPSTPLDEPKTAIKTSEEEILEMIRSYAKIYGVLENLAIDLARWESLYNPTAKNPKSTAVGIYQWLIGSWKMLCEEEFGEDRTDPEANIGCAIKTLAQRGGLRHWSIDPVICDKLVRKGYLNQYEACENPVVVYNNWVKVE